MLKNFYAFFSLLSNKNSKDIHIQLGDLVLLYKITFSL